MKGAILFLFIVTFMLSLAFSYKRAFKRFRRSSKHEFNSRLKYPDFIPHEHHFLQKLDHFNSENNQKWIQRYWIYPTYYKPGGPAFLFINGEWSVKINWTIGYADHWVSYAKDLNAFSFSLEHRFYGKSWPANENLQYLSSGQALADIANFIKGATEEFKLPKDINWIVFGCSYAGTLAAWARLKYPHLVYGAVASSAPLVAKADFSEYYQVVEESLRSYDPKCPERFSLAARQIVAVMNGTESRKKAADLFHLCGDRPKHIANGVETLLADMADILSTAVQYNDTTVIDIPTACDTLTQHSGTKFEAFADLRKLYMLYNDESDEEFEESLLWSYQICSEFGFFTSYDNTSALFGGDKFPVEPEIKDTCGQFFGPNFNIKNLNEKISHTNLLYGGLDINVGNMLFIHGTLDPWHKLGLYTRKNNSLYQTVFINGTSHCADVQPASDEDIPELKNARREIFEILKVWLKKKST